jgi:hypothetical protein
LVKSGGSVSDREGEGLKVKLEENAWRR